MLKEIKKEEREVSKSTTLIEKQGTVNIRGPALILCFDF